MATVSRARTLPHNAAVWVRRHPGVLAFAAVCGPGLLAGLSDDDPAGITTQDPELRKKFAGKPEHVVNFMRFILSGYASL